MAPLFFEEKNKQVGQNAFEFITGNPSTCSYIYDIGKTNYILHQYLLSYQWTIIQIPTFSQSTIY